MHDKDKLLVLTPRAGIFGKLSLNFTSISQLSTPPSPALYHFLRLWFSFTNASGILFLLHPHFSFPCPWLAWLLSHLVIIGSALSHPLLLWPLGPHLLSQLTLFLKHTSQASWLPSELLFHPLRNRASTCCGIWQGIWSTHASFYLPEPLFPKLHHPNWCSIFTRRSICLHLWSYSFDDDVDMGWQWGWGAWPLEATTSWQQVPGGVDPSNGDSPPITWEKAWRQIPNLGEAVGKKFVNSRRLISRFYFATVWGNIVNKKRKDGI